MKVFRPSWALAALFSTLVPALPAAQLGHVVKAQKISETAGGFGGSLDEQDQFGRAIVNLGDLNGDGVSDLLVGSHTDDDGPTAGPDRGSVWILFLAANGFVTSQTKISEGHGGFAGWLDPGDQFGRAACKLGDLDGDGVTEVAISANYDDDGGTNKGAVYVLFLRTDGTVKGVKKISQLSGGLGVTLDIHDEFSRSLTPLGDLDGDGVPDLLAGAPGDDDGGFQIGAAYVLFLKADGTVKNRHKICKLTDGVHLKPGDWFGFSGTNLGDLDGDGRREVAVGSVLDDDGGFNQGSVWILSLNADGTVYRELELSELTAGLPLDDIDQFGTSVANIGDLDGDGVVDLAVGAVKDDDGGQPGDVDADVGAVYVLYLRTDGTVKAWSKVSDLLGDFPYALDVGDWFGSAVARLGGASGDGLFNFAAGARYDNDGGGNNGAIYLIQLNDGTAPYVEFTADVTRGLAPLSVSFTDQTGGEVTGWVWTFNDGPASTQENPVHVFQNPGTYTIKLSAKGPKGTDALTKSAYITVAGGVLADFTAPTTVGHAPLTVAFDEKSQGAVTGWAWDFGDGTVSSAAEPTHLYSQAGQYTVTLTVSGPPGTDTLVRSAYVTVLPPAPTANFTATSSAGAAPLAVAFDDLSTSVVTSWAWSFGDGNTSNEAEPHHVYADAGSYTVTLTATGPGGSDVETKAGFVQVQVLPPQAGFTLTPASGPAALAVQFSDTSTGATDWQWDFGDGTTSTDRNPQHAFNEGTYTVSLSVIGPGGTAARTITDAVHVSAALPRAEFSATPTGGPAPLTVQFSDQSTGAATRTWNFGDGTSSNAASPAHVYGVPGTYSVTLTIVGASGTDVETKTDLVHVTPPAPVADLVAAPTSGVAPLTVQFADLSTGVVDTRLWSFGDGTSSSDEDPAHVYGAVGTYTVSLTVTGPGGSDVETRTALVTVLPPPPVAEFSCGPVTGFLPLPVAFTDRSLGATSWSWSFGDGTGASVRYPIKTYSKPGSYLVTLTVTGPGGTSSITHGPIQALRLPTVTEGGFEKGLSGQAPRTPWTRFGNTAALVQPTLVTSDQGFPSEGKKWLEVAADGTSAATPPAQPHGAGAAPAGAAGVQQTFPLQLLAPHLLFDAAFACAEPAGSALTNDFMSVDLSDGTTNRNLFYADTFSALTRTSAKDGLSMTALERVHVDLRALFPQAVEGTPLTLRVSVGNGGDGARPSRGYVDDFRLVPGAAATLRNGLGLNALRYQSTPAVLGGDWTVTVDTTGHPGAKFVQLNGMQRPASGTLRGGREVLISGGKLFAQSWLASGGVDVRTFPMPLDLTLLGRFMATQPTITGGVAELCNAYDLVLGF